MVCNNQIYLVNVPSRKTTVKIKKEEGQRLRDGSKENRIKRAREEKWRKKEIRGKERKGKR